MDWILICKLCTFGKYICYNFRDIKILPRDYFFGTPCRQLYLTLGLYHISNIPHSNIPDLSILYICYCKSTNRNPSLLLKHRQFAIEGNSRQHICYSVYSVSQKKSPPTVFWHFFPNGWEFLIKFLHTYYTIISTLDYKFLFKYLQLWQSYAILSATT